MRAVDPTALPFGSASRCARAALVFVLAATAVAQAEPHDELTFGSQARALRSASADALTDQGYFGGQLGFGRQLALPVLPNVEAWATAGFAWGGADGEMFGNLTTQISSVAFTVGGHARYAPYQHTAVTVGLDLGPQHAALTLTDQNARTASDGGWGLLAKASVALDLLAVDNPGFAFGLRAELGYVMTTGIALSPKSPHDDSALSLMTTSASIGHLDLGGPTFGISAITRF